MKYLRAGMVFLCFLLASGAWSQQDVKKLTNQDVIDMAGLGLSDDVVIEKIRTAAASDATSFDTSIDALKQLKAAKVSDAVIKVMVNPKAALAPPAGSQPAAAAEDPNLPPKEIGVYWKQGDTFIPIEGQNVSQAKMGGKLAAAFSYGIKAQRWKAVLNGVNSKNRVNDSRPLFYIYCPDGMGGSDYHLIVLEKRKDRREFEVGSVGGVSGGKSGLKESSERPFKSERVAPRTYKVTLESDLKGGEYGFFMGTGQSMAIGQVAGGSSQGRIFDFTIPE